MSPNKDEDNFANEPPTSINPYEILSIDTDATEEQIKKAYRKAALKHHPDKATTADDLLAKEKFQEIAFAYAILGDPRRRKRYDTTGSTSESIIETEDDDFDWNSYFREQYDAVTKDAIADFTKTYKGSEEERGDVIAAYTKGRGNMDVVHEMVMASNVLDDDVRFRIVIDEAIKKGDVERFERYVKESEKSKERRVKKAELEAKQAEVEAGKIENEGKGPGKKEKSVGRGGKAKGVDDLGDLAALIQQKKKRTGATFLEALEEKYAKVEEKKGKGKRKHDEAEPSEEAFRATAEKMKANRGAKRGREL